MPTKISKKRPRGCLFQENQVVVLSLFVSVFLCVHEVEEEGSSSALADRLDGWRHLQICRNIMSPKRVCSLEEDRLEFHKINSTFVAHLEAVSFHLILFLSICFHASFIFAFQCLLESVFLFPYHHYRPGESARKRHDSRHRHLPVRGANFGFLYYLSKLAHFY